jgi:hypothetical protein
MIPVTRRALQAGDRKKRLAAPDDLGVQPVAEPSPFFLLTANVPGREQLDRKVSGEDSSGETKTSSNQERIVSRTSIRRDVPFHGPARGILGLVLTQKSHDLRQHARRSIRRNRRNPLEHRFIN